MAQIHKLTIAVLTRNRCDQLIEALDSCIACRLPEETEYIVLDNASTDGTLRAMEQYSQQHPDLELKIYHSEENLGAGGGRNYLFAHATGRYVYFLDDDAIISPKCRETFFTQSIAYLDAHPQVASLSTQIEDTVMGYARMRMESKKHLIGGLPVLFFYLGGSQFLRRECFDQPLCFNIIYGLEECAPSICAVDKGYYNVCSQTAWIIHRPPIDKWAEESKHRRGILIAAVAIGCATKHILYPRIFYPVVWLAYQLRCIRHLRKYPGAKKEANAVVKQVIRENPRKKVRVRTVLWMYRMFGKTVW